MTQSDDTKRTGADRAGKRSSGDAPGRKRSGVKRFLVIAAVVLAVGLAVAAAGAAALYSWASKDLPGFTRITDYTPPLVTTVYARDGRVLGYFYKEKRFLVTLDQMPAYLPKAFLAAEDSGFYQHEGVDLTAISRAFFKNLQAGHVVQGGSTITQQVIKSLLLTPEKSYTRKLKEAILAYRLEKHLTKDEILTIYLNQIFFGSRAYGVEAAARVYFGAHVEHLTLAQSALLAGLPKAPSRYSPFNDQEAAKARQRYVLGRMLEQGWIGREQHDAALAEPLVFKSMEDPSWRQGAYYLEEVRRRLIDRFGEDVVYNAGLHVNTAVDLAHQVAAERAVRQGLIASAKRRGWNGPVRHIEPDAYQTFMDEQAVMPEALEAGEWMEVLVTSVDKGGATVKVGSFDGSMDVSTMGWCRTPDPKKAPEDVPKVKDATRVLAPGDVVWASIVEVPEAYYMGAEKLPPLSLALERQPDVEGALVSMEPDTGDVVALVGGYGFSKSQFNRATQARRQPGSAFKPIVYSTAMDNGFTPASIVLDAPIVYQDYINDKLWKPENFEGVFYGPTLLRTALVKSRNLVTIRVAMRLGIEKIIQRARDMGLESEFPPDLSVSLGSSPVTPINMAQAYSAFARLGTTVRPRLILRVTSAWNEEMYASEPEFADAISPQTAYIMTSLLKEVVRDGTGWRARVLKRPVAGKTGTTNNEQDAWYCGFAPYLLSIVYVGFDQLTPMGKWETGSRAASPIWVSYRQAVEANYPVRDWAQPPGVVMARVDAENGLLAGPGTEKSYFLPFKAGTQPTEVSQAPGDGSGAAPGGSSGEDLLKQIY